MRRLIRKEWADQIEILSPETKALDDNWCEYQVVAQFIEVRDEVRMYEHPQRTYVVRVPRKLWPWQRRKAAVQEGIIRHKQAILETDWESVHGYIRCAIEHDRNRYP